MAARYLPNGASSVGGAHRTAFKSKNEEMLIQEAGRPEPTVILGQDQYYRSMEWRLSLQQEEIKRR